MKLYYINTTNYRSAVIDKYGKEAGSWWGNSAVQNIQSPIIPTLVLTVTLLYAYIWL